MLYLQLRLISVVNVNGQGLWHVVAVTHLNEDVLSGHTKDRLEAVAMIH